MLINPKIASANIPKLCTEKIVLCDVNPVEVKGVSLMDIKGRKKHISGYFSGNKLIVERNTLPKGIYCVLIYGKEMSRRVVVLPE